MEPLPGDFILCHRRGIVPAIIRTGERMRFRSGSRWSHAAILETRDTVIEALAHGVVRTPLEHFATVEHIIVPAGMTGHDRDQAIAFARSCVGQSYGYSTIVGVALRFLTPGRGLWFGMDGTEICSGLVAQALVRGWRIFPHEPASMTPAELAEAYGVADGPA